MNKTNQYDLFTFREDNREKIDQAHVKKLAESIKSKNMLDLCPILVNENMEIIDGQHRALAAKSLGVEIYYQVKRTMNAEDIIRLNISKNWTLGDYLNFYCQHQYQEYLNLRNFMKENNLPLRLALNICIGTGHFPREDFRLGKFVFTENAHEDQLDAVRDTISYIKKMNGFSPYTESSRFWNAMLKLTRQPTFNKDKWRGNYQKMIDQFSIKATEKGYLTIFSKVYNYRNDIKIRLLDEEE